MRLSGSDPGGLCDGKRTCDGADERNGDALLRKRGRPASRTEMVPAGCAQAGAASDSNASPPAIRPENSRRLIR
jgi:hypothetical protein